MIDFDGIKLFFVTIIILLFYIYLKTNVYNYWKRHGVPHEEPSIPLGNISKSYIIGKSTLGNLIKENYKKFGHYPFHGFYVFHKPIIVINDPELIRIILVKEFSRFCDRGWFMDDKIDPMSNNLFLQNQGKWKRLRRKFTPTFTPNKIRLVYPLFKDVSNEMIETCDKILEEHDEIEMKEILVRYTTDIISSVVYGFKCCSLKNPNNDFLRLGIRAFEFGRINLLLAIWHPEILKKITLPFYHENVREFFRKTFHETVEYRRRENIVRKDFMDLLLQLVKNGELEDEEKQFESKEVSENVDRLTLTEAAAQAFIFFLAGFETTSSTATYCLLELAKNPDIQEKLQREIDEAVEKSGDFTYETVMELEYLDMVFSETLRKHPAVTMINRIANEDFSIPNSNFTIPKGMRVMISATGIFHNPKYFPEPDKFDPLRFTKESLSTRSTYVHLGFGEGPRNCIGKRFGLVQTKQAVATLLYHYKLSLSKKTKLPVQYVTDGFVQTPKDGIYLHLKKRR